MNSPETTTQGARVRHVREVLKMSQSKFAKKINVKQTTVAAVEIGKNKLTERNFKEICRVFNVNPQWLENGVGEIFLPISKNQYVQELCKEYELDGLEAQVLEKFLSLPPELREVAADWLLKTFDFMEDTGEAMANKKRKDELEQKINEGQAAQKELDEMEKAEQSALIKELLKGIG